MGAKTALLAFTEGDLRPALRGAARADPAEVLTLVRELHPGYEVTPVDDGVVGEDMYPPDDTSYAIVLAGAELFCDRRLVYDPPIATTRPSASCRGQPAHHHARNALNF